MKFVSICFDNSHLLKYFVLFILIQSSHSSLGDVTGDEFVPTPLPAEGQQELHIQPEGGCGDGEEEDSKHGRLSDSSSSADTSNQSVLFFTFAISKGAAIGYWTFSHKQLCSQNGEKNQM